MVMALIKYVNFPNYLFQDLHFCDSFSFPDKVCLSMYGLKHRFYRRFDINKF